MTANVLLITADRALPGTLRGILPPPAYTVSLAGTPDEAAGLECTLIGPRLEFTDERLAEPAALALVAIKAVDTDRLILGALSQAPLRAKPYR